MHVRLYHLDGPMRHFRLCAIIKRPTVLRRRRKYVNIAPYLGISIAVSSVAVRNSFTAAVVNMIKALSTVPDVARLTPHVASYRAVYTGHSVAQFYYSAVNA